MSISIENVSRAILQIMKGNGLNVQTFLATLRPTLNVQDARWFYAKDLGIMVHLTDDKTKPELKIMLSQGLDTAKIKDMYMSLREMAKNYNLLPTVRIFGKHLEPKDFESFVASSTVAESAFGSTRTSYHPQPQAKVVLRHSKPVAEEKPGSRSRNIKQIYIDNNQGERFKFDVPYLTAARAMARHVSDGGAPYDEKGRVIYDMAVERQDLRKLVSYARKNELMDGLDEELGLALGRVDEIDRALKRFHRVGGEIANTVPKVEATESSKIKFTVQQFDETLLPGLRAVEQQRLRVAETLRARFNLGEFEKKVAKYDGSEQKLAFEPLSEIDDTTEFLLKAGLKESYDLVMVRSHHLAETHMQRMEQAVKLAKTKLAVPDDKFKMSLHEEAMQSILGKLGNLGV